MPTPLAKRVLDGALAVYGAVTPAQVPTASRYAWAVFDFVPDRHGVPALIVSRTPNSPPTNAKRLRWQDWTIPLTVTLAARQDGRPKPGDPGETAEPDWRDTWHDAVMRLRPRVMTGVTELVRVSPNPDVLLDLTAYRAANLWVAAVNILVRCRETL